MTDDNKLFSVNRRDLLRAGGAGLGAGALAGAMSPFFAARAQAALSGTVNFVTWPNNYAQENLDNFTKKTGVGINVVVKGSGQEILALLQVGSTGWDIVVANNLSISVFKEAGVLEKLDLARMPNYNASTQGNRYKEPAVIDGDVYALPKNWGTSGFVVNTEKVSQKVTSWKDFFGLAKGPLSGRVIVPDDQLATIGIALKALGYAFSSVDDKELEEAEQLLIETKPHLFAINTDYQPALRSGDAWLGACWSGDAMQLNRDNPKLAYGFGTEGNEIWGEYYMITKDSQNLDGAYAFLDFLLTPENNAKEVLANGYPSTDSRVDAILPKDILDNPIIYPPADTPFEYNAAAAMVSAKRAEVFARFKAA